MNKKVECLVCEKQYYNTTGKFKVKSFIDIRTIPTAYIKAEYGTIENFIESEKDCSHKSDTYTIKNSNEYDNRYLKYINTGNKILQAIEIIRNNNNIQNKEDVLNYLLQHIN